MGTSMKICEKFGISTLISDKNIVPELRNEKNELSPLVKEVLKNTESCKEHHIYTGSFTGIQI